MNVCMGDGVAGMSFIGRDTGGQSQRPCTETVRTFSESCWL